MAETIGYKNEIQVHCRYTYERKSIKVLEDNKEKSHYSFTGKIILKNTKHIRKNS